MSISPTSRKLVEIWREHIDELPQAYKWENEKERENELYYCILNQFNKQDKVDIRDVVSHLSALNLIDTDKLADTRFSDSDNEAKDPPASAITSALIQSGLNKDAAAAATRAICEAARIIRDSYGGKIQKFLRKYAQEMIKELDATFQFTEKGLDKKKVFTMWLQNALEMPIILPEQHIQKFIKENRINEETLLKSADELDINPMVIDDLLRIYSESKAQNASDSGKIEGNLNL
jgi:hypothetical protein